MPARPLEDILRRIDQDPEDPGLLIEARGLLRRVAPADVVTRAKLCAAGLRLAPAGIEARHVSPEDPAPWSNNDSLYLSPNGRALLTARSFWDNTRPNAGPICCSVQLSGFDEAEPLLDEELGLHDLEPSLNFAFSQDGDALVLRGIMAGEGDVLIYDHKTRKRRVHSSEQLRVPPSHRSTCSLALSRDADGSSLILAINDFERIEIVTLSEGERHHGPGFTAEAGILALDGEGRRLAWVTRNGEVEVRSIATGERLARLQGHAEMDLLRWAPDNRLLGLGHGGLWVAEADGSRTRNLIGVGGEPFALALEPRGRIAFAAAGRDRLHIWDLEGGALLADVRGLSGLADIAVNENRGELTAVFEDLSLRVWTW